MLTNRILKEVLHGYTLRTITCNTYISAIQRHEHVNCCKTKTRRFFSWCRHEDHLLQISSKAITCEKRLFSASTNNNDLGKLLYIGREKKRLKMLLGSFYALGAVTAIVSPYLLSLVSTSVIGMIAVGLQIVGIVVLNPILLYRFGTRHVNELYFNKKTDTYTATLLSPLVYKDIRFTFTPKDCKMPAGPTLFTSFFAKNKALFINSNAMNYDAYMRMLRYASDFDFENPDRQEQYSDSIKAAVERKQVEQNEKTAANQSNKEK